MYLCNDGPVACSTYTKSIPTMACIQTGGTKPMYGIESKSLGNKVVFDLCSGDVCLV